MIILNRSIKYLCGISSKKHKIHLFKKQLLNYNSDIKKAIYKIRFQKDLFLNKNTEYYPFQRIRKIKNLNFIETPRFFNKKIKIPSSVTHLTFGGEL